MYRFTTLLLIFSALLVLVAATPAAKAVAPAARTFSLDTILADISIEVKEAGTIITETGLVALKDYSTVITEIITAKIGICLQDAKCRSITSPEAVATALGEILIEIQTKIDEIIGAFGIMTWASALLQMFMLPMITSLLTVVDLTLDTFGDGATFDSLLGLLDLGGLGNILGLIGMLGAGRQS